MCVRMEIASFCGSYENYCCLGKPAEEVDNVAEVAGTHSDQKTDEAAATSESSRKITDYQCK